MWINFDSLEHFRIMCYDQIMLCVRCGIHERDGDKRAICRQCHREQVYAGREARKISDPDGYADEVFNHELWTRFRLRRHQYDLMVAQQGGVCAICGVLPGKRRLHIDHDHSCCSTNGKSCGKCVRSLLCSDCNTSLGGFKDSKTLLLRAVEYLNTHSTSV